MSILPASSFGSLSAIPTLATIPASLSRRSVSGCRVLVALDLVVDDDEGATRDPSDGVVGSNSGSESLDQIPDRQAGQSPWLVNDDQDEGAVASVGSREPDVDAIEQKCPARHSRLLIEEPLVFRALSLDLKGTGKLGHR